MEKDGGKGEKRKKVRWTSEFDIEGIGEKCRENERERERTEKN